MILLNGKNNMFGRNPVAFVRKLRAEHGPEFVTCLGVVYLGVKGLAAGLVGAAALPLFMKQYNVTIERFQAYSIAIMTPWSMKPAIGLLSDRVPVFGLSKVPYMLLAAFIGSGCTVGLAVMTGCSPTLAALLLFGVSFEAAVVDLLSEGKYAEKMAKAPESGSSLPSFVWASLYIGSLLAAIVAGPMADAGHIRGIFVLAIPAAASVVVPLVLGWFPDVPSTAKTEKTTVTHLSWLAVLMAGASLGLTATALATTSGLAKLVYAVTASIVLIVMAHLLLPPLIARCNLYMFLASAAHLSLAGSLDYFYTAPSPCVKDGPHFSMTFYVTWSQIASAVASLLAIAAFQNWMQEWRLRPLFWVSTVVRCAAGITDVLIVNRLNTAVGIPDEVAYMLGNNVASAVAGQMDLMPMVVLTSKLCPPGMEATVYAILAGFQNFGGSVSAALGSALTTALGVEAADVEAGDCTFDGLSTLIVLCHMTMPLLVVPMTFILIPDAKLKETLEHVP